MDEEGKKELIKDFTKADGSVRLELWDYALQQQVLWEQIIAELQLIAHKQGVDKKLEQMMDEDMKQLG